MIEITYLMIMGLITVFLMVIAFLIFSIKTVSNLLDDIDNYTDFIETNENISSNY